MDWVWHGARWPHAVHSRFVACRPHRWHVQEMGDSGPYIVLLHGAGGATHSWRGLMPDLARDHRVVAIDLPGQGFSAAGGRARLGLNGMAEDIASLLAQEGIVPDVLIGHSAGGALALRMAQTRPPRAVVLINGALGKFPGMAGWLFPAMAKLLSLNPLSAAVFARTAGNGGARRLIASTGSKLTDEGLALYQALISDRAHVDGTLAMMAQWQLDPLLRALPKIETPVLLITGGRDATVPPEVSDKAARALPHAERADLPTLGHLAHEEAPAEVATLIRAFLARQGIGA
jgi:magnesium chelatase accessory protein